ncbi:hypothetical protein ACIOHS_02035 [Streptomyces sp. NPDC088253]|uniref:hypothetical protein n=1 Tax=Streptomyces sp. NPDC088253 TaxID=3365846 RepID=UPI00382186D1
MEPGNGQLYAAAAATACVQGVVAFVDEPDADAAEVLDDEQPVAERVGDLLDPALLRGRGMAGQQLDAATAVETRASRRPSPDATLGKARQPPRRSSP